MMPAALAMAATLLMQQPVAGTGLLVRLRLETPAETMQLPTELRELSGLHVLPDGRWLAHNDEEGIVYVRAPQTARWRVLFRFEAPDARGDFEAIATANGRVWLQTSEGRRRGRMLAPRTAGAPDVLQTERAPCEVESLLPVGETWWAACKRTGRKGGLVLVRQPMKGGRWMLGWELSAKALARHGVPGTLGISDAIIDSRTGHWLFVAGPERWLVETTASGAFVAAAALSKRQHAQPEALALLPDGSLLIGDEGARRGLITRYTAAR